LYYLEHKWHSLSKEQLVLDSGTCTSIGLWPSLKMSKLSGTFPLVRKSQKMFQMCFQQQNAYFLNHIVSKVHLFSKPVLRLLNLSSSCSSSQLPFLKPLLNWYLVVSWCKLFIRQALKTEIKLEPLTRSFKFTHLFYDQWWKKFISLPFQKL